MMINCVSSPSLLLPLLTTLTPACVFYLHHAGLGVFKEVAALLDFLNYSTSYPIINYATNNLHDNCKVLYNRKGVHVFESIRKTSFAKEAGADTSAEKEKGRGTETE